MDIVPPELQPLASFCETLWSRLVAHHKLNSFAFTEQGGFASFKAWYEHTEDLRTQLRAARRKYAEAYRALLDD